MENRNFKRLLANEHSIKEASEMIRSGGLVAFPTETVYGLGANGYDSTAVSKIFEVKKRPTFNPLILHIAEMSFLEQIVDTQFKNLQILCEKFWPGPLTIVLPKKDTVPAIVSSGLDTVAVRMPDNKIALQLIKESGVPIAAPSANMFGRLSPTNADHVEEQLKDKIDLLIDGGNCEVGVESTIIQINKRSWSLLRPGGLETEELIEVLGKPKKGESFDNPIAPGMLPFHYSPKIPLKFFYEMDRETLRELRIGVLLFKDRKLIFEPEMKRVLSEKGDFVEAASNLFRYLHEIEESGVDLIVAEKVPERGLGVAIMDRLNKASRNI
ncbi:MAG: threonylcarbamoyl-AMP synthase [Melioribacteraceae bacterium]|nr:threonylcarbamoyl-AMP synthase [Melioribacteraceae bacterium]MCF8263005.1 threonylcarbamoyl-AMP synthase [Melioribacteraceae bacterium]MCF8430450.1 threonylcarbamoyl-AMP synthase [Melioribacteraceae bacterium]